jgi:hypothetical protein
LFLELDMAVAVGTGWGAISWRAACCITMGTIRRAGSQRAREISMYEFGQGSTAPFDRSPAQALVRQIPEFNHQEKTGDEVDRIVVLFLICGSQKVRHPLAHLFSGERLF